MTHPNTDRIRELLNDALERPREARERFLVDACGDDSALLAGVKSLLQAHERSDSFLKTDPVGTKIGPYKLLQRIGEGGFGVVYMAEQQSPVIRSVALKTPASRPTVLPHFLH